MGVGDEQRAEVLMTKCIICYAVMRDSATPGIVTCLNGCTSETVGSVKGQSLTAVDRALREEKQK